MSIAFQKRKNLFGMHRSGWKWISKTGTDHIIILVRQKIRNGWYVDGMVKWQWPFQCLCLVNTSLLAVYLHTFDICTISYVIHLRHICCCEFSGIFSFLKRSALFSFAWIRVFGSPSFESSSLNRNDRGDTKNDDFWNTCSPDFITHVKSSGTMRDP